MILDGNGKLSLKAIVNKGDIVRIRRAMKKAENGEKLTLGFIGGSITEGAGASSLSTNYVSLTAKWWKEQFPNANVRCINAGIGATGSVLGVHRVFDDLLRYKPDFVVVEYAVNDEDLDITEKCFESLVRRILQSENNPGLMLMFLTSNGGVNVQDLHKRIGLHYDLPMVSFRDAVWPEIAAGRINWEDVEADIVHPNDNGHLLVSKFITDRLEEVYSRLKYSDCDNFIQEIKTPLISEAFYHAKILTSDLIEPIEYGSWCVVRQTLAFSPGWAANGGFNPLVFEVEGRNIGVIYKGYNTCDMGRVMVKVDDLPPKLLDGHFSADWGGFAHNEIIAENLFVGKHRVEITLCKDSHQDSKGREFSISGIMIS